MSKILEEKDELFKALFEENMDPLVLVNDDNLVISINKRFEETFGYKKEEIEGKNLDKKIVPSEMKKEGQDLKEKADEGFTNYETKRVTKEGKNIPVLISAKCLRFNQEKFVLGTYKVISERKKKEEKLKKYKLAIEGSKDLIAASDPSLNYYFANKAYKERYNVKNIEGKNLKEVLPEEEFELVSEKIKKALDGEVVQYQMERNSKREPHSYYFVSYYPLKEENGEVNGVVAILRDVTEKTKIERREEILHSILIHDVSNKLQIIKGYLNLLRETELSEKQFDSLNKLSKGLKDAEDIIKRVKVLKKIEKTEPEKYCPKEDLKKIVEELKDFADQNDITLELNLDEGRERILGGSLLIDLFRNILRNSIQHSEGSLIRIREEELPNYFNYIIEDDGKGVSEEDKQKIMKRGYSEKEEGGLGLFLAKEIVEAYEGHLNVKESELGGAKFQVFLKKPENN